MRLYHIAWLLKYVTAIYLFTKNTSKVYNNVSFVMTTKEKTTPTHVKPANLV